MSIREAARTAYLQSKFDLEQEARTALFDTLSPLNVEIQVKDLDITEEYTLYIFTDTAEDVHLGCRKIDEQEWEIFLVDHDGSDWSLLQRVRSLVELGEALPSVGPDDPEPDAWVSGNMYSIGDIVTHNGSTWESTVDNNSWEPGVAHSVWILV